MAEITRVLAAIVFTDVVGYSAKVQQDEDKTLALVARDLKAFSEVCQANQGRVVKNTGDGLLMFFSSLDSAVQAATQMLQVLDSSTREAARGQAANGQTEPENQRLEHRIGIHLGDVILQSDDVVGDGVNIAARLMGEAKPGTICISQSAFEIIKSRTKLQPTYIGPRRLKNIKEPVSAVLLQHPLQQASDADAPARQAGLSADGSGNRKPSRAIPKPLLVLVMVFPLLLMAGLTVYLTQFGKVTGRTTTSPVQNETSDGALEAGRAGLPESGAASVNAPVSSESAAPAPGRNPYAKVNLLDMVDVKADAVLGEWTWSPQGLVCAMADPAGEGFSEAALARVRFPLKADQLPREYDLNVSFTRNTGSRCVALVFPVGQGRAALELGTWIMDPYGGTDQAGNPVPTNREVGGICFINGRGLAETHSKFGFTLETSARYNVTVRVRAERVIVIVNGSERSRIDTTGENLTSPQWILPTDYPLGLGASRSAVTFHAAELVPYRPEQ